MSDHTDDKMTLNELKLEIARMARLECHSAYAPDVNENHFKDGVINSCLRTIERHRPALEAGMRGVLRVRKVGTLNGYDLLDKNGEKFGLTAWCTSDMTAEQNAVKMAEDLGMTAVFVDDEGNDNG